MKKLNNPFVVYGYKGAEYFCDRVSETEKIVKGLSNERNITLIAPRRIGKTGLIHHVFANMRETQPDVCCIYFNILSTKTLEQFVQLMARNVLGRLDTPTQVALHKVQDFFSAFRPTMTFDATSGMPTFSLDIVKNQEEQSDMFLSPERPLYQGAQIVNITEINERVYYNFANDRFMERGQQLPESVFHYIYKKIDGQTWYVQAILNRIYSNQPELITDIDVDMAIQELIDEQEVAFENYYQSLTINQAALLLAIAKEGNVKSPMAQAFISRYRLPALSSIKSALESLLDNQFIYQYNGGYIVYDRFFGMWLRERIE